jgi:hypothetical protein
MKVNASGAIAVVDRDDAGDYRLSIQVQPRPADDAETLAVVRFTESEFEEFRRAVAAV